MRKVWLHRDSVYNYKPFYKHKLKCSLLLCFAVTIVYFVYQIIYLNKLVGSSVETTQILVQDNFDSELGAGRHSIPTPEKQYVEVVR